MAVSVNAKTRIGASISGVGKRMTFTAKDESTAVFGVHEDGYNSILGGGYNLIDGGGYSSIDANGYNHTK